MLLDEEKIWLKIVELYRSHHIDTYALIVLSYLLAEIEEQVISILKE